MYKREEVRCRRTMFNVWFDNYKNLEEYITMFAENDMILPVLAESINAQLGNGILVRNFPFWRRNMPVIFDIENNKVYINYNKIELFIPLFRKMNILKDEKARFDSIYKNEFSDIMSGLFYYGVHAYNIKNRGVLIKDQLTLTWYKNFFHSLMVSYSSPTSKSNAFPFKMNTALSRQVSELIYRPFLQIIFQYYENLTYKGVSFNEDQEKRLDFMFTQLNQQVVDQLNTWNYSNVDIDTYKGWFSSFIKEFKVCFKNNDTIILKQDQDFVDVQEFEVLNLRSLQNAYYYVKPYMAENVKDLETGLKHRYPAPPFRELYSLAEPLAQTLAVGAYELKKLKTAEDLQTLAARGLATLS